MSDFFTLKFSIGDLLALLGFVASFVHFRIKIAKTEWMVEQMWKLYERGMKFVAIQEGAGQFHSPFKMTTEALQPFIQFQDELKRLFETSGKKKSPAQVMCLIEDSFGPRLEEIWKSNGFHPDRCILACYEIATSTAKSGE